MRKLLMIILVSVAAAFPVFAYAVDYSPAQCPVVGNTNSMIYHVPGGMYYARMLVQNKRGDNRRCFRTEAQAMQAGFRCSKR